MTADEVKDWLAARYGSAAVDRIVRFAEQVGGASRQQNLVSLSTLPDLWHRHILDSAQLAGHAAAGAIERGWLDVGTGAGFPGAIVALLLPSPVTLVEPRRRRADFLREALVGCPNATIIQSRVEAMPVGRHGVISARAVASIDSLFAVTRHVSDLSTQYILPRGRSIREELESARRGWHGMFHVEPSLTDADSGILVAEKVRPR